MAGPLTRGSVIRATVHEMSMGSTLTEVVNFIAERLTFVPQKEKKNYHSFISAYS